MKSDPFGDIPPRKKAEPPQLDVIRLMLDVITHQHGDPAVGKIARLVLAKAMADLQKAVGA